MSANNGPTINTLATLNERLGNNANYTSEVERQQQQYSNERNLHANATPELLYMSGIYAQSNNRGQPEVISIQMFSPSKGVFRIAIAGPGGNLTRSQRSLIRAALAQADEMEARGEM